MDNTVVYGAYKEGLEKVNYLIDNKKSFKCQLGASSIMVKVKDEFSTQKFIYSDTPRESKFMGLLSRIKSEVGKNADDVLFQKRYAERTDAEYFNFSQNLNKYTEQGGKMTIENCYEVDLTAAYYQAAYLMGYISKELFLHIIQSVPKQERLWLLGAIASRYSVYEYVNGEIKGEPYLKFSEIHKRAWINICNFIDEIMMDLKNAIGPGYLFYWVDGIYFKDMGDTITVFDNIRHLMFQRLINFRTKPIEKIEIVPVGKDGVELSVFKGEHKPTVFTIKKNLLKDFRPDHMQTFTHDEMIAWGEGKPLKRKIK